MSLIGPVVTGGDVANAVKTTVQKWQADYLAEVAEQHGRQRGDLELFRSWVTAIDLERWNEDQTPTCAIVAPATVTAPERHSGRYTVAWGVGIGAVVSGQDRDNTYELAGLYIAALRALLIQQRSLGGFAQDGEWAGERYDELSADASRTIMAGIAQFNVYVEACSNVQGPSEPSVDATLPPGNWPLVETVELTATGRS